MRLKNLPLPDLLEVREQVNKLGGECIQLLLGAKQGRLGARQQDHIPKSNGTNESICRLPSIANRLRRMDGLKSLIFVLFASFCGRYFSPALSHSREFGVIRLRFSSVFGPEHQVLITGSVRGQRSRAYDPAMLELQH